MNHKRIFLSFCSCHGHLVLSHERKEGPDLWVPQHLQEDLNDFFLAETIPNPFF